MKKGKVLNLGRELTKLEEDSKARISPENAKGFLVIKSGKERKRFSAWVYPCYIDKKGEVSISRRSYEGRHIKILAANEVLTFCKRYLGRNKGYLFSAWAKDILPQNEVVPEERKINFGKYKGCDIDKIKDSDKGYFDWVLSCVKKGEFVSFKLAEYIEGRYLDDGRSLDEKYAKIAKECYLIEDADVPEMVECFMTTTGASFLMAYKYLKELGVDMDAFMDDVIYTDNFDSDLPPSEYFKIAAFLKQKKEVVWALYLKLVEKGWVLKKYDEEYVKSRFMQLTMECAKDIAIEEFRKDPKAKQFTKERLEQLCIDAYDVAEKLFNKSKE